MFILHEAQKKKKRSIKGPKILSRALPARLHFFNLWAFSSLPSPPAPPPAASFLLLPFSCRTPPPTRVLPLLQPLTFVRGRPPSVPSAPPAPPGALPRALLRRGGGVGWVSGSVDVWSTRGILGKALYPICLGGGGGGGRGGGGGGGGGGESETGRKRGGETECTNSLH